MLIWLCNTVNKRIDSAMSLNIEPIVLIRLLSFDCFGGPFQNCTLAFSEWRSYHVSYSLDDLFPLLTFCNNLFNCSIADWPKLGQWQGEEGRLVLVSPQLLLPKPLRRALAEHPWQLCQQLGLQVCGWHHLIPSPTRFVTIIC